MTTRRRLQTLEWHPADHSAGHIFWVLPGTKKDAASCREFLRDLKARGLRDPVAVITDGAPGLIRAVEEVFPKSLRQRCLAHKLRNLQSKVPEERWREVIPAARATYQAPSLTLAHRPTMGSTPGRSNRKSDGTDQ